MVHEQDSARTHMKHGPILVKYAHKQQALISFIKQEINKKKDKVYIQSCTIQWDL